MSQVQSPYGAYAGFRVDPVEDAVSPGVVCIRFNQPDRLNAFSAAMKRDLMEALFRLSLAPEPRVLIFVGDGGVFSAGDDFRGYYDEDRWTEARSARIGERRTGGGGLYSRLGLLSQRLNATVRDLDLLTIAAIEGPCMQSGLSLALCCDFRIAAETSKIGSATLRFGYQPDENGHYLLLQHLGLAKTLEFLLRQKVVSGREALELGLLHQVATAGDVFASALALANELAEGPQVAMRLLKRAIYNAADLTFNQAGEDIASKTAISDHHPDAVEGVAAFRDKRKPRFNQ
ncbi:hypothetical protein BH10PSE1_BH10PSE1_08600 [soil metagenome]